MKVILTQELKGRGGEGDVIDVARGFAVNYLLPRKIAIEATPGNLKQLEQRRHNIEKRESARIDDAASLAASLEGKTVTVAAKVGEEGRLFGSVTTPMIHQAVLEQLGVDIDRRKIETHGAIKEVGPHEVSVAIYRDVRSTINVEVVAEGSEPVAEALAAAATEPVAEEVVEATEEEAVVADEDAETAEAEEAAADEDAAE